jgi:hypothetical protein
LLLAFAQNALAQNSVLILKKRGNKVKQFNIGSSIRFTDTAGHTLHGEITDLKNDSLFLNYIPFHINEISIVYLPRFKSSILQNGMLFQLAGAGYTTLATLNTFIENDQDKGSVILKTLPVSLSFIAVGTVLNAVRIKKYKLGSKYKLVFIGL